MFGSAFGPATSAIFGGSIDAGNAATYLGQSEIDGALVGAGMQTAPGFLGVLDAFYQSVAADLPPVGGSDPPPSAALIVAWASRWICER
jgi:hypothetical protein